MLHQIEAVDVNFGKGFRPRKLHTQVSRCAAWAAGPLKACRLTAICYRSTVRNLRVLPCRWRSTLY